MIHKAKFMLNDRLGFKQLTLSDKQWLLQLIYYSHLSQDMYYAECPITSPGWEQQVMFVVVAELGPGCWCTADSDAA